MGYTTLMETAPLSGVMPLREVGPQIEELPWTDAVQWIESGDINEFVAKVGSGGSGAAD